MPYWRLSTFYFVYFASLGALLPYWSLYLRDLGFGAVAIGELMALPMLTKVLSPWLWGWIADHCGRRMLVVRIGGLLALVAFGGIFFVHGYWPIAAVMFGFSFFWNAVLSPVEATTLTHLGRDTHRYSRVRLWGSVGFIAAVVGLGAVLQVTGPGPLPGVLFGLFAAICLSSFTVPDAPTEPHHTSHASVGHILRRPEVLALLFSALLMQASHGPYYTFFTIYMEGHGYSRSVVGELWALGVVAEVGIFLVMTRLLHRYTLRWMLLTAYGIAAVRWLLIGTLADNSVVVIAAQLMHAATFGIHHAVVIALVHRHFRGRHHAKGQGIYAGLAWGSGGALGSYYSGYVWESLGPAATFAVASAMAAAAFAITWRWVHPEHRPG